MGRPSQHARVSTPARTVKLAEKQRKRERIRARQTHIEQRVLRDQRCTLRAAHYARAARTLLHLLAIPSRLCLTWLRLSLEISNASSVMRGGGGDACVDGNRRDSGGMLHACLRMKSHAWTPIPDFCT